MIEWWDSLTQLERVFAAVAIPSTIILLLQTVLLLFGLGGDHDGDMSVETDHDTMDNTHDHTHHSQDSGLRIFTVRGFVAFFSVFGWAGIVFLRSGMSIPFSVIVSLLLGVLAMVFIAVALVGFLKLQSDGTTDIHTAIGLSGTVYISIPPSRSGTGKITALVSGSWGEFDACTDCERKINTDEAVLIVAVSGGNTLVVMPNKGLGK